MSHYTHVVEVWDKEYAQPADVYFCKNAEIADKVYNAQKAETGTAVYLYTMHAWMEHSSRAKYEYTMLNFVHEWVN